MTNDDLKQKVFALITKCEITGNGDDTCYFGAEEITDLVTTEMVARIEAAAGHVVNSPEIDLLPLDLQSDVQQIIASSFYEAAQAVRGE